MHKEEKPGCKITSKKGGSITVTGDAAIFIDGKKIPLKEGTHEIPPSPTYGNKPNEEIPVHLQWDQEDPKEPFHIYALDPDEEGK